MDPFSVAASIVGILGAAVQISEILRPFVSTVKDAATVAAQINAEVNTCATILSALQGLLENLSQTPVERQSLIEVDSLTITLTEGVLIFDALVHLLRQLGNGKRWSTRIQWAWKRDTLDSLVKRMQLFKASVTLMLNILQRSVS